MSTILNTTSSILFIMITSGKAFIVSNTFSMGKYSWSLCHIFPLKYPVFHESKKALENNSHWNKSTSKESYYGPFIPRPAIWEETNVHVSSCLLMVRCMYVCVPTQCCSQIHSSPDSCVMHACIVLYCMYIHRQNTTHHKQTYPRKPYYTLSMEARGLTTTR